MKDWPVQYLIGTSVLAEVTFRQPTSPHSFAFCCATCGDIWARVWTPAGGWDFETAACEKHERSCVADWGYTPGSLLWYHPQEAPTWARPRILGAMPPPVLKRELALHINAVLRKEDHDD